MVTITSIAATESSVAARSIQEGIRFLTDQLVATVGYSEITARSIAKKAISRSMDHKCTIMVAYVNGTTITVTTNYKGILS